MLTPFDLHVLSTPPAFILSQDQTLLFYSGHSKLGFSFFTAFLGLFRSFFFSFSEIIPLSLPGPAHLSCFGPPSALRSLASLPVRIFTASEYFQGCITVYLSRFQKLHTKVSSDVKLLYDIKPNYNCQLLFGIFFCGFKFQEIFLPFSPPVSLNILHK